MNIVKFVSRLFKKRLSENDEAQAQIMGMALAAMKASEVNTRLLVKQAIAIEGLKILSHKGMLAHYTVAADQAKQSLEEFEEGTLEYEGMLMMSSKLYEMAALVEKMGENNKKTEAKNASTEIKE